MQAADPKRTLVLMCGVALLLLAGAILLSRQQQELRIDRDREALRVFATESQIRIQRLESLYQGHLLRLGRGLVADAQEVGRAAGAIEGVLQVSLLHSPVSEIEDFHAMINASPSGPPPLPALSAEADSSLQVVVLDEERLFERGSAWIDEPGKPLMFHVQRSPMEVAVITVSRSEVGAAIRRWMASWADERFAPVRAGGGPDQLRDDRGALVGVGDPGDRQPDLLLPLISRFGNLDIASWDVRKTVVKHHPVTLAAGCTLSVIVVLLAVVIYIAQKRQQVLAAQRVSFVNSVSHELRTPLTNILLNIDLAIDLAEDSPDQSVRRLGLVRPEAMRLGRLIENVLTFSRSEKGRLEVHPVACVPKDIINGVIEQWTPGFDRRGLSLNWVDENTGFRCVCDPDALTQILGNLLSNVEKYASAGEVTIHSHMSDGELVVRVQDKGPGIPKEAAKRIFEPFERVNSKLNEGESGTGLGLAISRDLAQRLGGSLKLLPAGRGTGSCFELRIPAPVVSAEHPSS